MDLLRIFPAILLLSFSSSIGGDPIENGIECTVKPLSEFWANDETKKLERITGCEFSEEYEVSLPNTRLTNLENFDVVKFVMSNAEKMKFLPNNIAETFPNLKRLKGYRSGLQALTYDNLQHLSKVDEIDFRKSKLENIEENAFKDTLTLKSLALSENKIKALPENVFAKLENLEDLYLGDNELTRLEPKLFADLKNLKTLDLGFNKLKTLEPGVFDALINLRDLSLKSNEIKEIPANILAHNKNLWSLILSSNEITSIDVNLLAGKAELDKVSFSENPFEVVDFNVFKENVALREIYLKNCKIKNVANIEVVDGMEKLDKVQLSENVCIDELYDFHGLQFKLKRDINKKCKE